MIIFSSISGFSDEVVSACELLCSGALVSAVVVVSAVLDCEELSVELSTFLTFVPQAVLHRHRQSALSSISGLFIFIGSFPFVDSLPGVGLRQTNENIIAHFPEFCNPLPKPVGYLQC